MTFSNVFLYLINEPCCDIFCFAKVVAMRKAAFQVVHISNVAFVSYFSGTHLNSAMTCTTEIHAQTRQMKEALFMKKVEQNVKEEQANHFRW